MNTVVMLVAVLAFARVGSAHNADHYGTHISLIERKVER